MITALVFLLILSVLVLIHELGHYLVAKKFNIKVEEFGYGLPPRAWGKKIGETLYSINWLPIGGFVKLYGEDEAGSGSVKVPNKKLPKKDLDRAFFTRPVGQRAAVVVAGVVMNVLLAVFLYYVYMGIAGFKAELPLIGDHDFFLTNEQVRTEVIISGVAEGSPADRANITEGSRVVAINGERITGAEDFSEEVKERLGEEVALTLLQPDGQTVEKELTPRENPPEGQGALGVGLFPMKMVTLNYETPVQRILSGISHPANLLVYNFDLMARLVQVSVQNRDVAPLGEGVAGPVGIYSLVGTIVDIPDMRERILQIINLAGILSISLAFFNILPIPALDGGRLFFIMIEAVTRKKINPKYEALAHTIGMVLLLTLILLITFKDIFQFILR